MNVTFAGINFVGDKLSAAVSRDLNITPEYYKELKSALKIKVAKDCSFVRIGNKNDGGYIMSNNLSKGGGVAYSFGISNDVSWDADMANRGYDVFMYDMTIDGLPANHPRFHFFKEGISGVKNPEQALDTLENFIIRNGHNDNEHMILKMDVEGAEWDFLETVPHEILNKFDQMVFEFHDFIKAKTMEEMVLVIRLIKKINVTHTLVHLHANNFGSLLNIDTIGIFPDTLELTYLKNGNHTFYENENIRLPIELDMPNWAAWHEIQLGYWNKNI